MKGIGRAAGAIIFVLVVVAGLALLFNSMRAAREQTVAAPPTPSALGPTLVMPQPTPGQTPTAPPVAPTLTPTPGPTPFPTPSGPPPTVGPSRYISREVVVARVGSGPGEIGIKVFGGLPAGPAAFALDSSGNIYIADNMNQRINKYNPDGRFVSATLLPDKVIPRDIAVDELGDMYVLDGLATNVLKLNPGGDVQRLYTRPAGVTQGDAVRFLPDGTLVLQGLGGPSSFLVARLGTSMTEFGAQEKAKTESGYLYKGGVAKPTMFRRSPDGRWGIMEVTLADRKVLTLNVALPEVMAGVISPTGPEKPGGGEAAFEDIDSDGNVYVSVTVKDNDRGKIGGVWLLKYAPAGSLLGFVPFPTNLYTWPNSFSAFRVDQAGNIYFLQPYREQVEVIRWEWK